jgi:hypothetical protein
MWEADTARVGRPDRATNAEHPGLGCAAALLGLGVVFAGLVGLFALAANAIDGIGSIFSNPVPTQPEEPIPIPGRSCPYLREVHDTAAASGQLYLSANALPTRSPDAWLLRRAQLRQSLAQFDGALRRAIPRVPPRVAKQLLGVLQEVRTGEENLTEAATFADYNTRTFDSVFLGYLALGNASGLVGNACGFALQP